MSALRICLFAIVFFSVSTHADSLFSKDSNPATYVGYGYGLGTGKEVYDLNDEEFKYEYDLSVHRFSVGFISERNHRFELSYRRQSLDFDEFTTNGDIRSFDIDGVAAFSSGWLAPYVTAGLGFTTYRTSGETIEGGADLDGFSFNYGIGLLVNVYETIELDVAYRGNSISWEHLYQGTESEANKISQQNNQNSLAVGVHVIF